MGKTHALVIGMSEYKWLLSSTTRTEKERKTFGLRQLQSPAIGAFHFYKWLKDKYNNPESPLATCSLLLSPSDLELRSMSVDEQEFVRKKVKKPTTARVRKALLDWFERSSEDASNVAILYIAGHGIRENDDANYVLLYDFAEDPLVFDYALHLERVFHSLKGPNIAKKLFVFVDACRTNARLSKEEFYGNGLGLPRFDTNEWAERRVAPIFQSTAGNSVSFGIPGQGTIFSKSLLACLNGISEKSPYVPAPDDSVKVISQDSLRQALEEQASYLGKEHNVDGIWITCEGISRSTVFHVETQYFKSSSYDSFAAACEVLGLDSNHLDIATVEETYDRRLSSTRDSVSSPDLEKELAEAKQQVLQWLNSEFKQFPASENSSIEEKQKVDESFRGRNSISSEVVKVFVNGREHEVNLQQDYSHIGRRLHTDWWLWSICINGHPDFMNEIESVNYVYPKSFRQAAQRVNNQDTNFLVESIGCREFEIRANVKLRDGLCIELRHRLTFNDSTTSGLKSN